MLIFWRLLLGHLLADFTFQSNLINRWKRRNMWGMLFHCSMHPVTYIALTYPYLGQDWVQTPWLRLNGWACIFLISLMHYVEDEWRIFSIFRREAPDNTLFFAWDQIIHCLSIFIFLPVGLMDLSLGWIPERWPVLLCLAVVATHFCTVLIYFLEKDLYGTGYPDFDEKYLSMAMRVVLALCCMLPGSWWVVPATLWMLNIFYLRYRRIIDFSWFSLSVGAAVAILCGLAARSLYFNP